MASNNRIDNIGGVWYFPLYDNNGNVTDSVSETGEVVASYAYDAFGRTLSATGPMASVFPFRFSTKYYDTESGLYYYGYRYYSPELGRWLTRDPIEEDGGDNLYAFCGNNGLSGIDPYGLSTFVLIYDSVDPMFKAWAEDSSRRIQSNSATPYRSPSVKNIIKKQYPKTKFSIVGSERGVSNGFPWDKGWPRPVGFATKQLKVTP